ncbi:MAG: hypothetical protein E6469_01720 [Clostridium perfringens]|uniref:hypothetical protein n=1 Tax=Clostridium perfringens TaxID=1502 RepID=UPI001CCED418|nr:hypothetical protein [Clostridium perfringens]MDH5068733.1 hypothetical protein [Clostridium perfringens]MDH5074823.1 hypothetical protein [Clostridium perfringens]MDH5088842.1 hypothetical protein [Clostridium perfringens]MDU6689517.1 hypothetical protein [Clostridium perfringens]UBK92922.1 hypothetical protein KLF37_06250 [Clostridium perfringens]
MFDDILEQVNDSVKFKLLLLESIINGLRAKEDSMSEEMKEGYKEIIIELSVDIMNMILRGNF